MDCCICYETIPNNENLPKNMKLLSYSNSDKNIVCAYQIRNKEIYGLQFHPEVTHTKEGYKIISNFLLNICKCEQNWYPKRRNFLNIWCPIFQNRIKKPRKTTRKKILGHSEKKKEWFLH